MKKKIHVNQFNIKKNAKEKTDLPVVTVKCSKGNFYGHHVIIGGPSKVVYPGHTLSCGAKVWMETNAPVMVLGRDKELIKKID